MDGPTHSESLPQTGVHLTEERLELMLNKAAAYGARKALADIGLHDEDAASDVRDLRGLLDTWRDTKRTAWKTFVSWGVKGLLILLIAGFYIKTGHGAPIK